MRKNRILILLLLACCLISSPVYAAIDMTSIPALQDLSNYIEKMVRNIHEGASEMMKIADMLICNAIHGKTSYVTISTPGIGLASFSIHLVNPMFLICGAILYALGFLILVVASFYMFDVALNIAATLLLLPIGLALWPFGWTRDKLGIMIESIAYYTGLFIFLPLGILIGVEIVKDVASSAIRNNGGDVDLYTAFEEDNADALSAVFGIFSLGFLKILLCYVVALRIIPLMATEFCNHFFGSSLLGNPIHEKVAQFAQILKKQTIDRAGKHGKNIARAAAGNVIQQAGDRRGNFLDRSIYQYGKRVAKPKK